jgi:hypothetical protein
VSINDLGLLPRFVLILGTSEKFDLIKVLITWSRYGINLLVLQGIMRVLLLALQGMSIRMPHYTYTFIPNKKRVAHRSHPIGCV